MQVIKSLIVSLFFLVTLSGVNAMTNLAELESKTYPYPYFNSVLGKWESKILNNDFTEEEVKNITQEIKNIDLPPLTEITLEELVDIVKNPIRKLSSRKEILTNTNNFIKLIKQPYSNLEANYYNFLQHLLASIHRRIIY